MDDLKEIESSSDDMDEISSDSDDDYQETSSHVSSESETLMPADRARQRWDGIAEKRLKKVLFLKEKDDLTVLTKKCLSLRKEAERKTMSSLKDGIVETILAETSMLKTSLEADGKLDSFRILLSIILANSSSSAQDDTSLFNCTELSNIIGNVAGKFDTYLPSHVRI